MKKILSHIIIALIISANLLAPFSVGFNNKNNIEIKKNTANAAEECEINNFSLTPEIKDTDTTPSELVLTVSTSNCIGQSLRGQFITNETYFKSVYNFNEIKVTDDNFSINFKPGEKLCEEGVCNLQYNLKIYENKIFEKEAKIENTPIKYSCINKICNNSEWSHTFGSGLTAGSNEYVLEKVTAIINSTDNSISVKLSFPKNEKVSFNYAGYNGYLASKVTIFSSDKKTEIDSKKDNLEVGENLTQNYSFTTNLTKGSTYIVSTKIIDITGTNLDERDYPMTFPEQSIKLGGDQQFVLDTGKGMEKANETPVSGLPSCWDGFANGGFNIAGCIAQGLYYLLFKPTSFLFGLTGKALDFTFMYSISDTSYRSQFVLEGWAVVRDFCNMFFIFVLLYIAFGTILGLHGVNPKEMIVKVVIIGLLINFSLFTTQVIIDASNVLARVFYNQKTIITGTEKIKNENGKEVVKGEVGEFGEIKLSEAIVTKVNPVKLITSASKVSEIPTRGAVSGDTKDIKNGEGISPGGFIIVILLATIVNIVGMIAFLMSALMFISRVIGLWLAMILVPMAFFSYTVPSLQDIDMVGWRKWWPETLKLAFMAPVFAFFLYLIVAFLDTGLGMIDADSKTGLNFVIAIMVPFIMIMVLLMKAKDVAKDMSGKMGQSITNGIAAAGSLALGGAALGGAFLGKKVVGRGLASMSRGEGVETHSAEKLKFNSKLEKWEADKKANGGVSTTKKPTWEDHKKEYTATKQAEHAKKVSDWEAGGKKGEKPVLENEKIKDNWKTRIGSSLNKTQKHVGDIDHARHEMDEAKKAAGLVDSQGNVLKDIDLSGEDKRKLQVQFDKSKKAEVETNARKGLDGKGNKIKVGGVEGGEEAYKAAKRKGVSDAVLGDKDAVANGDAIKGKGGKLELTDAGKKKVENQLNADFNIALKDTTKEQLEKTFEHLRKESTESVGMLTRGFARSNKASYDVRNISGAKTDKRDGVSSRVPTALIAGVALGVRTGLKSGGINHGQGVPGDFMKNLSGTITEALKNVKVELPKASSGGGHGGGDSHGGGHGGGGHH